MKLSRPVMRWFFVVMFAAGMAGPASAQPKGKGWTSLFNGKDLTGWRCAESAKEMWTVVDGVIDCNPKVWPREDKNLWTEKEYKDFVLHVEWRIKETKGGYYEAPTILPDGTEVLDANGKMVTTPIENADSGIYLRGSSKAQVNIWCWPIGSGEMYGYRRDKKMPAEVRAGVTPKVKADKPVGEWNTFVITVRGDRVTVVLNEQTVIERVQLPELPESGPLALQIHGGWDEKKNEWNNSSSLVQFRNIYIRELK